jgi:hypothetical protein
MFEVKARLSIKFAPLGLAQAPLADIRLDWKSLSMDKHSSLLRKFLNYG